MNTDAASSIVMLAGPSDFPIILYNKLAQDLVFETVIVESAVPRSTFFKRRIKNLGFSTVIGQLAFSAYNRFFVVPASRERLAEIKRSEGFSVDSIPEDLVVHVQSVNSDETLKILRELRPKVVLVTGTRIIHQRILDSIDGLFINIHSGITPKYRGVHGGYWALAQGDEENCGVTVHLVDAGIDTGNVLYQSGIITTADDNFNTYPYLQLAAAVPLVKKAIRDVLRDDVRPKNVDLPSRLWSHPTLFQYLKHRKTHRVR